MVKRRAEHIKHVELLKWYIQLLIEYKRINKQSIEYNQYEQWISTFKLPKGYTLSLHISFWHTEMFSQGLCFCCTNKNIFTMASDSFWEIDHNGEKLADDGTWYFYFSQGKHPVKSFKNELFENFERLFKRLLVSFKDSEQLRVGLYYEKDEDDD